MRSLKRDTAAAAALVLLLCCTGCGADTESSIAEKTDDTPFAIYLSNTFIATGNNTVAKPEGTVSYRAYLPVEQSGELEYCFYFSNTVDSTWMQGEQSYVGMPGGAYTIESAEIGYAADPESAVQGTAAVTFDGAASKPVAASETFWSDPVTFDVPAGNYLVWTWTLTGDVIPAIAMSNLAPSYSSRDGGQFGYCNEIPLPQLIGCKREAEMKIAMIGDSITQGCGTTQNDNAFWVANIAKAVGDRASVWNLGLGHARASDCVTNGDWLQRAAHADLVLVAFGTNDIQMGQYGVGQPNAASAIDNWLRKITGILQEAGCEVILLNAPPFDYDELHEGIRTELNAMLPATAEELGVSVFDWASLLSDPDDPAKTLYGVSGGHPNDEGCKVISDAFLEQFADRLP